MWTRRCRTISERRLRRAALWLAVSLGAALVAGGCPFTPRDAPAPLCPLPADFREPLRPETVRDNIRAALRIHIVRCGADSLPVPAGPSIDPNYQESLDSGFVYLPDLEAHSRAQQSGCPTLFDRWTRRREVQFMRSVLEAATDSTRLRAVDIRFTRFDTLEATPERVRYNVDYRMTLEYPGRTDTVGGNARWDLVGGTRNFWTLKRWEDLSSVSRTIQTLGVLRVQRGQCE